MRRPKTLRSQRLSRAGDVVDADGNFAEATRTLEVSASCFRRTDRDVMISLP